MRNQKIVFTGSFGDYFFTSLGLLVVSIATVGFAMPYWIYWQAKYFFEHMEIENNE